MTLKLYFSLVTSVLFLALEKNNELIAITQKNNDCKHSDEFINTLEKLLNENNCHLNEINSIYFASGPGRQTGIRISLTFVSIISAMNEKLKIFPINTLKLQSANKECISIINTDSKEKRGYLIIYNEKGKEILKAFNKTKEEIENIIKKTENKQILKNLENINLIENFNIISENMVPIKDIELEIEKIADEYL